jgi:integrase
VNADGSVEPSVGWGATGVTRSSGRWGELRALRVSDVQELPSPAFWVARSQTEGGKVKVTKGRLARRVPLADVVIEVVRRASSGKSTEDYLATGEAGGQLWRSAFQRSSAWDTVAMGGGCMTSGTRRRASG